MTAVDDAKANLVQELVISKILDKHTLVASGHYVEWYVPGERVYVVAEAGSMPDGTALVVPKAELEVRENGGKYVILGAVEEETHELPSIIDKLRPFDATRKIKVRIPLPVKESQMSGNPASRPIAEGDVVIKTSDFKKFVAQRTEIPF